MGLHRLARSWRQWWQGGRSVAELDRWRTIGKKARSFAAYRYLRGNGIEIGALNTPLQTYHGATVRYVDRLSTDELRRAFPEVAHLQLAEVDQVDDAEDLASIPNESCDFVIANHVLEHTQNPIRGIENMLRVLKLDGILYLVLPDKRFTFDTARAVTSYEHLKRDYLESPAWSEADHYRDWIRNVGKVTDEAEVERRARQIDKGRGKIHFHVWTQREFIELVLQLRHDFHFPIEIEALIKNSQEFIVVLRKADLG